MGAFTRISLFLFYVQPEIILTNAGTRHSQDNKTIRYCCTKLDIPAMVGFSLFSVVRVQAGPTFSFLLKEKERGNDSKERYRSPTVGWQAGLGIDIWKIVIDLKYEGGLSRLRNTIAGIYTNHGRAPWVVSVGVNIL